MVISNQNPILSLGCSAFFACVILPSGPWVFCYCLCLNAFPAFPGISRLRVLCAALIFFISANWAFFARTQDTKNRQKRQKTDKFQLKARAVVQKGVSLTHN